MAYRKKSFMKRRPKKTYKRKSMGRKTIKKVVRREISRSAEKKNKQQFLSNKMLYGVTNASFPDNVITLGPNSTNLAIVQGTGQGNRIGNRITTKSLVFKGTISPTGWNTTTNQNPRPLQVRMLILYDCDDPNAVPVPGSTFFQDGSSSVGFTNTMMDLVKPYNTDRFRILAQKTFKLGMAQYAGTATSIANQDEWQAYTNNDFKLNCNFSFNLTKFYPKQVKFNDNLSDPTTRGLYCLFYYIAADGSAYPSTHIGAMVNYMQNYVYEDA